MTSAIAFFGIRNEATAYLSNFYVSQFYLDDERWLTVEHFYQAHKFADAHIKAAVRSASTPGVAKRLAYRPEQLQRVRPDWHSDKRRVMLRAVAAKFCLGDPPRVDLIARLLATRTAPLLEVNPKDGYWGVGATGDGANHLGRTLMAIRAVLLACDHEQLQRAPLPLPVADTVLQAAPNGAIAFHHRVVAAAGELLDDPEWSPTHTPPGIHVHVLRGPLYGEGVKAVREALRPWLGAPLAWCWAQDSFNAPEIVMQPLQTHPLRAQFPHGLMLYEACHWRFGTLPVSSVGVRAAEIDWVEPAEIMHCTPPWWNLFDRNSVATDWDAPAERLPPSDPLGTWALQRVWVTASSRCDDQFNTMQYAQPVAHAIALEFFANSADGGINLTRAPRRIELFTGAINAHRGRVVDRSTVADGADTGWTLLLCSPALGGLPCIEAAVAIYFAYEGIELPAQLVAERRACQNIDDGWDGLSAWCIDVAFGVDADGEFLDMDTDHRKTSAGYYRFYENGRQTSRDQAIEPARFLAASVPLLFPAVANEVGLLAGNESAAMTTTELAAGGDSQAAAAEPSQTLKRALGALLMMIGGVIAFELASSDPRPLQAMIFAAVLVVFGALVVWRPEWVN